MHSITANTDAIYRNLKESEFKRLISELGEEGDGSIGLSDEDIDRIASRGVLTLKIPGK